MSLLKGSSNGTVSYSDGGWNSNDDVVKRLKPRSLATVVGVIAVSLGYLYEADVDNLNERETGVSLTYETFVRVRWPWFILPVMVETMGLGYFVAVAFAKKRQRPLWKGSILAALFHGLQHSEYREGETDLDTASGMTTVAERTSVMLRQASSGRDAGLVTVKRQ